MALRMRIQGIQTFIISPDKAHEFRRACGYIGGGFFEIQRVWTKGRQKKAIEKPSIEDADPNLVDMTGSESRAKPIRKAITLRAEGDDF